MTGRGALAWTAGAAGFCTLVVLNVGGYRYGVSDQAFYIPVVLQELTPGLFPHDATLLAAQDRYFVFDDWLAPLLDATGMSLPTAFLGAYALTLLLLYGAAIRLGGVIYSSRWALAGLLVGLAMRHRIPDTAVNSLEGYFHPRVLAFAVGLWGVAIFLRGRTWLSLAVACLGFAVHPTTALWFIMLLGPAGLLSDPSERSKLLAVAGTATAAGVLLLVGPLRSELAVMDPTWVELLSVKDYLNPTEWPASTWLTNLGLGAIVGVIHRYRRRLGLASERERGLVGGVATLVALFLVSVPLSDAHVALVVQLQVSRIFWLLDTLAIVYVGWLLIDSPGLSGASWSWIRASPRPVVVVTVLALALARGGYVTWIDPAGRRIAGDANATADWNTVMEWASRQPVGTHFLADPAHAALYGSSVRAASARDVFLEEVKDVGIAIYSADIAHRVRRRLDALGHFNELTPERARRLAHDYELDYLITEQELDLPEARRAGRLRIYALASDAGHAVRALGHLLRVTHKSLTMSSLGDVQARRGFAPGPHADRFVGTPQRPRSSPRRKPFGRFSAGTRPGTWVTEE